MNPCDTFRVQVESWCGGGLIHIHPVPSVLLDGASWPRGGPPASVAHTWCRDLQCRLVAGQSSNLFLFCCGAFFGVAPPRQECQPYLY